MTVLSRRFLVAFFFLIQGIWVYGQNEPTVIEAESGTVGAEFSSSTDGDITFVSITTDFINTDNPGSADRTITFSVTFPAAGTYDLYGKFRVGPNGADDDSFFYSNGFGTKSETTDDDWITMNNLGTAGFTAADDYVTGEGIAANNVWKWINLSEFSGQETPISFVVDAGNLTRTFQIGAREDGIDFDKFAFAPSDLYYTVSNLENGEPGVPELPDPDYVPPIADGQTKFLGNVYSTQQAPEFENYWNQVTPENAGKWGSVEGTRDQYNWGQLDNAYNLAKDNGFPFKLHVLIWGNQQPSWIENLSASEQLEEIEEWFDTLAAKYPDMEYIEVVNEPLHDPPNQPGSGGGNYIDALGGNGTTGWDWVVNSFKLARTYFPNSDLIINDYGIINNSTATNQYLDLIDILVDSSLVDGIGIQAHAFTINDASATTITNNLNILATTGLPIYVTELDVDGTDDMVQLERYQRVFPAFWEHPDVQGITLWGYRPGMWRTDQGAILIESDGTERPSIMWLRAYVNDNFKEVSSITVEPTGGTPTIDTEDGTLQMTTTLDPTDATISDVIWSVDNASVATINSDGLLTAVADGTVVVKATAKDGSGTNGTLSVTISNQASAVTGIDELGNLIFYPNPAQKGIFTVKGLIGFERMDIMDIRGNMVKSVDLENLNSVEVQMIGHPKGIYIVQLFDGSQFIFKKIVLN